MWSGDSLNVWGQPFLLLWQAESGKGSPGSRYTFFLTPRPSLCCGSAHTVLHVAQDTGPMGTQDGLWPGDAGAVMQQGWGTLATSPHTAGGICSPSSLVSHDAMARDGPAVAGPQPLTCAMAQPLARHPSFL